MSEEERIEKLEKDVELLKEALFTVRELLRVGRELDFNREERLRAIEVVYQGPPRPL
jgi:hypothetical protein